MRRAMRIIYPRILNKWFRSASAFGYPDRHTPDDIRREQYPKQWDKISKDEDNNVNKLFNTFSISEKIISYYL